MDGSTLRIALCSSCVLLRSAAPSLSCDSLLGHYAACSAISPSRAETGEFQAVIVLYTVEAGFARATAAGVTETRKIVLAR